MTAFFCSLAFDTVAAVNYGLQRCMMIRMEHPSKQSQQGFQADFLFGLHWTAFMALGQKDTCLFEMHHCGGVWGKARLPHREHIA